MPPIKEREEARRERQLQKQKKRKRIAVIVIIIVFIILLVMKAFEFNFNSVKKQLVNEDGSISISAGAGASDYPYALDSSDVVVTAMSERLNLLTDSSVTVLNLSNAEAGYSFSHGYANPIISSAGDYFCLIDEGSNRFRLDSVKENIYEINTDSTLLCADVNKRGKVAYATQGKESKSTVVVITKNQLEDMRLDVNDGYVVSIAIDSSGKKLALATINSKNTKLVTTVYTYSVGKNEPVASFEFVGTNVMDLNYSSAGDLFVVGTDFVSVITNQKKQRVAFDVGKINTNCFGYTDKGELVLAYSEYSGAMENVLVHINGAGKVKLSLNLGKKAKYVSSASNCVTVLFSDSVVSYSLSNGKEKASASCDETVTTANRLSSKIFVTRQQLVDILG